jgi:hypothetical protein
VRRRTLIVGGLTLSLATPSLAAPSLAVLELFTSQGCSSCPPADALLGELAQRPEVIALAWHVDYWNDLGWKDPYASRQWTERQKEYARQLKGEVYTPALVVNGASMVVGSDRRAVAQAMKDTPAPMAVSFRRTATGLEAQASAWPEGASATLVFYDPENATAVAAGENGGRRLKEYRIVREAQEVRLTAGTIALPPVQPSRGAALLVRDAAWRIIAAADLPPNRSVS